MSQKFGYDSVEDFQEKAQARFSLLNNGILDQESAKLLLINVGRFVMKSKEHPRMLICGSR